MITETLIYTDLDGQEVTEELHFHLTVENMTDHLEKQAEFESMQRSISSVTHTKRELTNAETKQWIDMVKFFIKLSYGKKTSVDGKTRFKRGVNNPDIWDEFVETGAHDAFLKSMFQDVNKMLVWLVEVMPNVEGAMTPEQEAILNEAREARNAVKNGSDAPVAPAERLPRGTRIVDDVPQLKVVEPVPEAIQNAVTPEPEEPINPNYVEPAEEEDFEAIMAAAEAEAAEEVPDDPKTPITQQQHDLMKAKLSSAQFEKFMSTRRVVVKS